MQYQPASNLPGVSQSEWGAELHQAEPAALYVTFQLYRTGVRSTLGASRWIGGARRSVGG
jgi:hypothetical protein